MRMRKMFKKGVLQVMLAMIMLICQVMSVAATGVDQMPDLEAGKKGTLSVTLSYKNEEGKKVNIEGVTLEIFKAADLSIINGGAAIYTLTSDFAESNLVLEGMNASETNQAATAMEAIVVKKGLKGQSAVSDKDGKVVYKDLEPGMYLVMQTANAETVPEYTEMETYLIAVPQGETENGNSWNYEVNSLPKTEIGRRPEIGTIEVTKRTFIKQDHEILVLDGAQTTYHVGLFLDEEGTTLYPGTSIQTIEMNGASAATVKFTDLMEGTYYVFETTEDGTAIKPGEIREDDFFRFSSSFSTEQKVVIDQSQGVTEGKVVLDNIYEDLPDGYLMKAKIEIKKSVFLGSDRVTVDDTFYAGIFTKADGEYILNQVVELEQNGKTTATVVLAGTDTVNAVKYWIFETDKDGNRVDKEIFPYEVSGEGAVTVEKEGEIKKIEIVNKIKEQETEAPTETETEKETEVTTVETGDNTMVEAYLALTVTALLVLIIGLSKRRKRKED